MIFILYFVFPLTSIVHYDKLPNFGWLVRSLMIIIQGVSNVIFTPILHEPVPIENISVGYDKWLKNHYQPS